MISDVTQHDRVRLRDPVELAERRRVAARVQDEHECGTDEVQVGVVRENLAVDVDEGRRHKILLDLDIGVAEGAASEARKGADGVLEVRDFLGLRRLANVSALGAKAYQRSS